MIAMYYIMLRMLQDVGTDNTKIGQLNLMSSNPIVQQNF